jgi:hypothetical protein
MRKTLIAAGAVAALACSSAQAAIDIYSAALFGANECAGVPATCGTFGDPDGLGGATVMIDTVSNTVTWSIYALGIESASAAHIHAGPAGTVGPVIIDFDANFLGSKVDDDAASITPGTAQNFYVNVHTPTYPGGAIRGQLQFAQSVPEPETYAMMLAGLGVVGLVAARRRNVRR